LPLHDDCHCYAGIIAYDISLPLLILMPLLAIITLSLFIIAIFFALLAFAITPHYYY